ncbi:replication initiator protein A [Bradyrhizobium sp. INPA03-11B]|uniref:replication initiator protein A n=1 Tax=Bradyrhizobium sp. INPA03-11B TaxID=418598 RepID=UPI00338D4BD7
MRCKHNSERGQLDLFRAFPGDLTPRDAQDLMAHPFFSFAKTKRIVPIDFSAGAISIHVEAVPEYGMATIWDANLRIWPASQIVEAREAGLKTSRRLAATSYEILTFVRRGTSARNYDRLEAGLDRPQSTTVQTSIRQPTEGRWHRFSWMNKWKEMADAKGRLFGLELILTDWFYAGVIDDALVLTIFCAYSHPTDGVERWLYRLVPTHGGRQHSGWSFDLVHLHAKSGILSPLKHFAYDVRQIDQRQTLPGYQLGLTRDPNGTERLNFAPTPLDPFNGTPAWARSHSAFGGRSVNQLVLSGTRSSCYRGPKSGLSGCFSAFACHRNFTNQKSFGFLLTDQITSRIGGDCQRQAAGPAYPQKPHTLFELQAHGSQSQRQGAAA